MYKKPFYIKEPIWNNAFSYDNRVNKQLYIPNMIEIDDLEKIELWNEIAFEDFDFDDKLSTNYWLKNFYKINAFSTTQNSPPPSPLPSKEGGEKTPIYLFDNHNHAFYFWYLARSEWIIGDNNTLIHIDEHADTRDSDKHLLKPDSLDLFKVFEFTNNVLNVWDYIKPAIEEGIIWEVVQIRNESNLLNYFHNLPFQKVVHWNKMEGVGIIKSSTNWNIILNLDLDFFQPDLDYIDYELKKKVILDVAKKASVITVSTSPFFINQELAIKVFKDLFWA
jgi:hypothetical protein